MSRGPGRWQREILRVTSGTVVATVSGVVRTTVVSPDRDDFTAARRGAKQLALAQRVCAVYAWTCIRCSQIQDSDDPVPCCGPVRAMLAVCQPERRRLLQHTAPAPGGKTPAWINVVPPARPPGQLQVPGIDDLARLVLRRCYERVLDGEAEVTPRDAAALLRLQRELDRQAAGQVAGTIAQWEATMREVLWAARRHLGDHWEPFVADIRANQHLAAMWGPPRQSGTAPGTFPGKGR
jgi:hypothetical protein